MNENEIEQLNNALKQINRCLDERFEENADLYIAPEQVENIKKLIYAGNYDRLVKECSPALKKYSPQVMANVLIKNAWLMKSSKYETLKPIFEECSYHDLNVIMEESVLENKIAMPSDFRLFLIEIYLNKVPAETCRQMLNQNMTFLNNMTLKALCLRQMLKAEPQITNRYKIFHKEVLTTPAISTQNKILAEVFPSAEINDDCIDLVFEDNIAVESPCTHFWIDILGAENVTCLMSKFKHYCRRNASNNQKCREVLGRLLPIGKKNFQVFAAAFAEACQCMDGYSNKKFLAEKCLTLTPKGTDEENILKTSLTMCGLDFDDMERGHLASIEEIKEAFGENFIRGGKYRYLVQSFDKQYRRIYKQKLDEIMSDIDDGAFDDDETAYAHFEEFCCYLVERTDRYHLQNLKYMLYVIDNLVEDDADKDDPIVERLLKHIENNNLFVTCQKFKEIEKIKDFVHKKDFDLYCRLHGN